jgi:multicomponent Na+:H+ antiporter subunit A
VLAGAALLVVLGSGVVAPLLVRMLGRNAAYPLAVAFLVAAGLLAGEIPELTEGTAVTSSLPWVPSLGISASLYVDGLAMFFAQLVLLIGAVVLAYSARYLEPDAPVGRVLTLMVLFAASMLGFVLAGDLVLLFVCWELTSITSFLLIGGKGTSGSGPALRALIVTAVGGLALLAGVVLLAIAAGSTDLGILLSSPSLIRDSALGPAAAVAVVLAVVTKSAQVPFHFWLPGAMVAPTPVSAYLHAATLVKAGIYLLLRTTPLFSGSDGWLYGLTLLGLVTAVFGAATALRQTDLKALLAYSTVSQLGFLIALIGLGTTAAIQAAVLHTAAHALYKGTLFMAAGVIDEQTGSRDIRRLSGLRRTMPVTAAVTGIAGLSMAGVPPLVGFVSKEEAFKAFLEAPGAGWFGPLAAGLALASTVLTFAYGLRIFTGVFLGPSTPGPVEASRSFLAPAVLTGLTGLVLGIGAAQLNPAVSRVAADTLAGPVEVDLALWHGFTPALALSAATIVGGMLLWHRRTAVDAALDRIEPRWSGDAAFDRCYDATLALGARVAQPWDSDAPARHIAIPILALCVLGVGAFVVAGGLPAAPIGTTRTADWFFVGVAVPLLLGLMLTRSPFTAVTLLGVTGFLVAGWFLLAGGPDLALTQLLVETLTVLLVILVLRRLPDRWATVPHGRRRSSAALAIAAGGIAGFSTLVLTGARDRSDVAQYVLDNAEAETGGTNVVNTVLVDFRALDTLGETAVVAAAALGLGVLLGSRSVRPGSEATPPEPPGDPVLVSIQRMLLPVVAVTGVYLVIRGHDYPGGGFIGALVAGAALMLRRLARGPAASQERRLLRVPLLLGVGLSLCLAAGLLGWLAGASFLDFRAAKAATPWLAAVEITPGLVFDFGIFSVVLGLVVAVLARLHDPAESGVGGSDAADEAGAPREPAGVGS